MRTTNNKRRAWIGLLGVALAAALASSSCGGSEPDIGTANYEGTWTGTWITDDGSHTGGVTVSIYQDGASVTGNGRLVDVPLFNSVQGTVTATVTGQQIQGTIDGTLADLDFSATMEPSGARATGTYVIKGTATTGTLDLKR